MSNLRKYKDPKTGKGIRFLYVDIGTGIYWLVKRYGKVILKKSLQTTSLVQARYELNVKLAELGDPEAKKKAPLKLMEDCWNGYRTTVVAKGVKESTLTRIDTIWSLHLYPYLGKWPTDRVQADMMPSFISWHRDKFPGARLFDVFKYLRALLRYMVKTNQVSSINVPDIDLPLSEKRHQKKKKGRYIKDSEFERIEKHTGGRFWLIVQIAYHLGMRKMEIGSLRKNQITEDGDRLFIDLSEIDTKTGIPRVIPVPSFLKEHLLAQINSQKTKFVFPRGDGRSHLAPQLIDRDWRNAKLAAGISDRIRFHDLRHTCATNFAKRKANSMLVASMLGMSLKIYQNTYLNITGHDLISLVEDNKGNSHGEQKQHPEDM